jgi:hypothetical protein
MSDDAFVLSATKRKRRLVIVSRVHTAGRAVFLGDRRVVAEPFEAPLPDRKISSIHRPVSGPRPLANDCRVGVKEEPFHAEQLQKEMNCAAR